MLSNQQEHIFDHLPFFFLTRSKKKESFEVKTKDREPGDTELG